MIQGVSGFNFTTVAIDGIIVPPHGVWIMMMNQWLIRHFALKPVCCVDWTYSRRSGREGRTLRWVELENTGMPSYRGNVFTAPQPEEVVRLDDCSLRLPAIGWNVLGQPSCLKVKAETPYCAVATLALRQKPASATQLRVLLRWWRREVKIMAKVLPQRHSINGREKTTNWLYYLILRWGEFFLLHECHLRLLHRGFAPLVWVWRPWSLGNEK